MPNLDPKRYDLAIKQLQEYLNGNIEEIKIQKKTIVQVQESFEDYKTIVADEITAIAGEFEIIRSDIADFNTTVTNKLIAQDAEIENLYTTKLSAEDADIKYATIENLNAINAVIENLDAVYATIEELEAASADIDNLSAGVADIKTLMFGSATGTSLSVDFSNAVASLIGNGYIKDAMIEELSFDKITGFDINTTNLTIHSQDGKSQWKDNTIQISDANRVRVQIGKDASNDYSMSVWDAEGNLMFDALGLTEGGIQREIIRDDMVAQDAAINASKLDIESLFEEINEDKTHTLKSTKVYFDSEQQTLDLVFNSMRTDLDSAEDNISSALTKISAVNGEISILVQEMDTLDGEFTATKTLAEQTADKFSWIVKSGTGSTNFTLTDRVAELVADQINLSGLVTFSGLDSNAQEKINSAVVSTTVYYALGTSEKTSPATGWSATAPAWEDGKYMWQKTTVLYADGTDYTSEPTCITGATGPKGENGSTGPQGPAGEDGRGVKTAVITYQKSISGTTIPTGTWSSTIPSVAAGEYLWTKTVLTYTDNTTSTAYSVGMMGATGPKGQTGATGSAGKGVKSTVVTYQASTSGTTAPTGTWSTSIPSVAAGSFLWTRTVITYTDNTTSTSYSVGKMGNTGAAGKDGEDGKPGIDFSQGKMLFIDPSFKTGVNSTKKYANSGTSYLTWARAAKSSDNPMSDTSYEMVCTNTGAVSPSNGGFYWGHATRSNAVFVYRIIAKIPTGRALLFSTNSIGTGGKQEWLTSQAGTGKFTEYLLRVECGGSGTFSSTGFFYVSGTAGTASAPLKWYVAYATCFDMTNESDSLSNSRTIANWCAANNKTLIDGAKIYTGSIGAQQIDVDDVFAQDITATGSISGATLHGAKSIGIGNYEFIAAENGAMILMFKE